jgi:hypothetical protein
MMVDASSTSLLAEFDDSHDFDSDTSTLRRSASRFASLKRQQPSRTRQATEARYSRKRSANSNAPTGPRRRFRKANGL